MRRPLRILLRALDFLPCAACAAVWLWSLSGVQYLHANFWHGSSPSPTEWRGHYLGVYRGQLFFESERILFAAAPTTPPPNRWRAEDAVGIATPALRGFPFRGPLGFQWEHDYSVSPAGSLHTLRFAFPLWAAMLVASLPLVGRAFPRRRRRH